MLDAMLDVLLYVLPEVLRKAKTEAERRSSAALMAAINTLYFIRQSSAFDAILAQRPLNPGASDLLSAVAGKGDLAAADANYFSGHFSLPNYHELYKLRTSTLVELRESDEAKAYFVQLRLFSSKRADERERTELWKRHSDYTKHICNVAMVESGLAARERVNLYLSSGLASKAIETAEICYRGIEKWSDSAARKIAAIRWALERHQILWLKNAPGLQKQIEDAIRGKKEDFFLPGDESGTRYDQIAVDVRRQPVPPSGEQDKEK
jgi:hypothetical protein